MTTGHISLDIMLIIMLCTSAAFTIIGIMYPVCKRLGITCEDGVIEFGNSDITLRIRPQPKIEKHRTEANDVTEKIIYN